jgi:hypothetical protein
MFVGHYGVSYAIKAAQPRLPLWLLFLAVQIVDVAWAIFILLGVEKARIVPGITASNPLDLYYMPYTHSLVAAFAWSAAALLAWRFLAPAAAGRLRAAWFVALAVFSHWLLDLVVHRPDLPLYDDQHKLGLGLWDWPATAFALETGLLFGGMWLYLRATRGASRTARIGPPVLGLVMLALQASVFFGAPPPNAAAAAVTALFAYFVLAATAFWLERKRTARVA